MGPRRPRHSTRVPRRRSAKNSQASKSSRPTHRLGADLADAARRLHAAYGVAVAAELAPRAQTCEQDSEIAHCLRLGVVDGIAAESQRFRRVAVRLGSRVLPP